MSSPAGSASAPTRAVCARCRRPERVCYCRHVQPLETTTRVVLLQHPRERDVAIGTARMASLCLPGAELHVGVDWDGSAALARALSDPTRPAALLYPGPGAIDVTKSPPPSPITLIVVDGTWAQTRKLVRDNPRLAALPRYAFTPPAPSAYRIRREPDEAYVSTIEALAQVLGVLERDPVRFQALLRPFQSMVETQLAFARRPDHGRHRPPHPRPPRPKGPAWLGERTDDLVCVVAEANAWPYRPSDCAPDHPDELVHCVACHLSTGETFEAVIAPRNPLSPRTPSHLDLPGEALLAGVTIGAFLERWQAFLQGTHVLCAWGHYAPSLLTSAGACLPPARLDVRQLARGASGSKVGTVEDYCARLGIAALPGLGRGRAGARLGRLVEITRALTLPSHGR